MKLIPSATEVRKFLIIFYLVGIVGFAIPQSKNVFIQLIPLALLLNFGLLLYFHRPQKIINYVLMLGIAVSGFFVEVIGVQSGLVFGSYTYGTALGPKFMATPLLIGVNWLLLTYSVAIFLNQRIKIKWLIPFLGATLVTFFDVIMEPVAIYTGMWHWSQSYIPLQNYLAWFGLSVIFISIFIIFNRENSNKLAQPIFFLQLIFFAVLLVLIKFVLS